MRLEEFLSALSVRQPEPSKVTVSEVRQGSTDELVERFNKALTNNDEVDLSVVGKTLFHRFYGKLKRTNDVADSLQEIGNMISLIYHKLH